MGLKAHPRSRGTDVFTHVVETLSPRSHITVRGYAVQLAHAISRGERFPLNFGRDVVARLAGQPELADWKKCAVTLAEEEERTAKFKEAFKAWDPL